MNNFNKEKFSELLTLAKGTRGINQFGKQAGISGSYLSNLISLKREAPPSMSILTKIAAVAYNDVKLDDLMNAAGYSAPPSSYSYNFNDYELDDLIEDCDFNDNKVFETSTECKRNAILTEAVAIPLLKDITASNALFKNSNVLKYYFESKADVSYGSFFYFIAPDNSMINSKINKGDILTIKSKNKPEDNKIFLVFLNKKPTLRRLTLKNNYIIFTADNPSFEPDVFHIDKMHEDVVEIIGKVTYVKIKL